MASADDGAAAAAAAAGGSPGPSKRPASPGGATDEGSKRQRLASHAAAGPSGGDPLDAVPDAPMHLLRVRGIPAWANEGFLGVRLADLVRGPMKFVLASNYMMDFKWLLSACPDLRNVQRLLLVHGERAGSAAAQAISTHVAAAGLTDKTAIFAPPLPISFGTHHSKAFIIEYERGLRVVIFSANAIYPDCNNKSQGLFWQDFPKKDAQSPQTSTFQEELDAYVRALNLPLGDARRTLRLIAAHDFSAARAHIVASVPGYHTGSSMHKWGHMRLRAILNREPPFPSAFKGAPVVAQFSSLGSIEDKWLREEFLVSLSAGRSGDGSERLGSPAGGSKGLQLVWTTVEEVRSSLEGWFAGNSIPGPEKNVGKPFLQAYWHRWGGEVCGRQRAAPHMKSYLRYRGDEVAWQYVGSHNLSKAAWGQLQKNASQLMCRSYELGVLLLPSLEAAYRASRWVGFSCTSDAPIPAAAATAAADEGASAAAAGEGQRYQPGDEPWMVDRHWSGKDILGFDIDHKHGAHYGFIDSMPWI
ncbi:tyrosyl-DNA phosphodiesterase 1 [Chlorella sorokiniana]|uniref:Tyrosyl-DNA phosphodiesterase 1 n=1 Tax=Chlorella sorokiniana TaxID=3076 RepID=A0A2P6U000_CHLSO|nr:tyrosyl-DNA phosphodiesterase 1 [Chlorella sorokiniana]|eukprot:PRW59620.1 tyrosyl-DNA phosphodiesterase 1 [Chlorella sorokiniana]